MDIQTTTKTVTEYTIVLTEADVAAILVDATPFQGQLRALRAANGQATQTRKSLSLNGHGPKPAKEQAPRAAGKAPSTAGKGKFAKEPCPECKRPVSMAKMATHRRAKHAVSAAASPASA